MVEVTDANYESVILDTSKNVVAMYYAPWDPHSQELFGIWTSIANDYKVELSPSIDWVWVITCSIFLLRASTISALCKWMLSRTRRPRLPCIPPSRAPSIKSIAPSRVKSLLLAFSLRIARSTTRASPSKARTSSTLTRSKSGSTRRPSNLLSSHLLVCFSTV